MSATSIYPVLLTTHVETTAEFYREHFGFTVTFDSDWYISLRRDQWELAVLDAGHETVPDRSRGTSASGVLINVEVDDVDAEYARLVENGPLEAVLAIRSEAFGQRHFIVPGPDGVLIDVISPIEPGDGFAEQFTDAEIETP